MAFSAPFKATGVDLSSLHTDVASSVQYIGKHPLGAVAYDEFGSIFRYVKAGAALTIGQSLMRGTGTFGTVVVNAITYNLPGGIGTPGTLGTGVIVNTTAAAPTTDPSIGTVHPLYYPLGVSVDQYFWMVVGGWCPQAAVDTGGVGLPLRRSTATVGRLDNFTGAATDTTGYYAVQHSATAANKADIWIMGALR